MEGGGWRVEGGGRVEEERGGRGRGGTITVRRVKGTVGMEHEARFDSSWQLAPVGRNELVGAVARVAHGPAPSLTPVE